MSAADNVRALRPENDSAIEADMTAITGKVKPNGHCASPVLDDLAKRRAELDTTIKAGRSSIEQMKSDLIQFDEDYERERRDRVLAIDTAVEDLNDVVAVRSEVIGSMSRFSALTKKATPAPKPASRKRTRKAVEK